jgi:hypothetical protein
VAGQWPAERPRGTARMLARQRNPGDRGALEPRHGACLGGLPNRPRPRCGSFLTTPTMLPAAGRRAQERSMPVSGLATLFASAARPRGPGFDHRCAGRLAAAGLCLAAVLAVASEASASTSGRVASYFSQTSFDSNTPVNYASKPPLSYDRGVGTAPNQCPHGGELVLGGCWRSINDVYSPSCPSGKVIDGGLCYDPCDPGYAGVASVCWISELGMACDAFYNPALDRSITNRADKVLAFGLGGGFNIMHEVLTVEYGHAYGTHGEYGCYRSICTGESTDVSVQAFLSMGVYDGFANFLGDAVSYSVGASYGPAGAQLSVGPGAKQFQISLGIGFSPIPISLGKQTCDTDFVLRRPAITHANWATTCQNMRDQYGIADGNGWGTAPLDVQDWWMRRGCGAPPAEGNIAIQAANGQYLTAEDTGAGTIVAKYNWILGGETWRLVPLGGDKIALRSWRGHYLGAHNGSTQAINVNNTIGPWETLTLVNRPDGKTAIRAATGKYLHAIANGGAGVAMDGQSPGVAESFKLVDVHPKTTPHSVCTQGVALNQNANVATAKVCAEDPYCCGTEWDAKCVQQASVLTGQVCPGWDGLVYGRHYHIKNGYLSSPDIYGRETYLDTHGMCGAQSLCVVSGTSPDRDPGYKTGTWEILSAQGKAPGEPVRVGDLVHIRNQYFASPDINGQPTYLDTNGMCGPQSLCVRTSLSPDRDPGFKTGTWRVESATNQPHGTALTVGEKVHLRNEYFASPDINGQPTYLDTNGSCGPHTLCVRTSLSPDRDPGMKTGTWMFVDAVRTVGSTWQNPARSCKAIYARYPGAKSGRYWIDPNGGSPVDDFPVYCDMESDGGGWTKILHTPGAAYAPSSGIIGDPSLGAVTAPAKLADAQINAIGGAGALKVYRFAGDRTSQKLYLETTSLYTDEARAMNLTAGTFQACEAASPSLCAMTPVTAATIDTNAWGFTGNDCNRFFTDYGQAHQCHAPGDDAKRCFNTGASCNWTVPTALTLWVRESDPPRPGVGDRQSNAGATCKSIHTAYPDTKSGTYWLDPNGGSSSDAFTALCDMESDGGGWTKILHTPGAYLPNQGAVGFPAAVPVTGPAKLSDAQINAIGGAGTSKTYRLRGHDSAKGLFFRTSNTYVDTARAMNLTGGTIEACEATSFAACAMTNITSGTIDSHVWGMAGNDCDRFFADYAAAATCGSPGGGPNRCFQAGVACGGHKLITAFTMWVREDGTANAGIGQHQDNPGATCKAIHTADPTAESGPYWIDPDGGGATNAFQVHCDMESDGGGWTKILHSPASSYLPTPGTVGSPAMAAVTSFAKLSDARINAIGGPTAQKTYRFQGDESDESLYLQTSNAYVDTARAMSLTGGTIQACEAPSLTECAMTNITSGTIDSHAWGMAGNDCDRFFTDYAAAATCGSPGGGPYRCFQAGAACDGHTLISGLTIWVRE